MEIVTKRKINYLVAGILIALYMLALSNVLSAQNDQGYIYGTVTTIDNKTYTGQIRWGKEETFWDDIFNSTKGKNPHLQYLERGDYDHVKKYHHMDDEDQWNFWKIWEDSYSSYTHSFAVRFGDIKSITLIGRKEVELKFKNGETQHFEGGSNDIGARISVFDHEIGEIKIKWDRIDKIDFEATPSKLKDRFGEPLYGTVVTRAGDFQGMVQWDHEECLTTDRLDGDSDDGYVSIPMGNIASIKKDGSGSMVTFRSGRQLYLSGTNDVDEDNRGVIVKIPEIGKIKIGWDDFESVEFKAPPVSSGPAYDSYGSSKKIQGTVQTIKGIKFSGRIVYDLDKEWDYELLHGNDDEIEYVIPFRNIKSVTPKNFNYSTVELRNGEKLLLGGAQDVSDRHDGILVFRGDEDPTYIPWEEVETLAID